MTGLARDTRLELADEVEARLVGGRGYVIVEGERRRFHGPLLAVLDAFAEPRSLQEGLDRLSRDSRTALDFLELSSQVLLLVEWGVLVPEGDKGGSRREQECDPRAGAWSMHAAMLQDRVRTRAYLEAIAEAVHPGDVVVDLGTGTGILAIAAAKAGARRVYAVEHGPIAATAERLFADNDVADRVTLLRGLSTRVDVPEKADVLVTEIFGHDPFGERVIEYVRDAASRWLKPGGRVVPERLRVHGRAAQLDDDALDRLTFTERNVPSWCSDYGMSLERLGELEAQRPSWLDADAPPIHAWLSEPALIHDLAIANLPATLDRTVATKATGAGRLDAAALTFELDVGRTTISTAAEGSNHAEHWKPVTWLQPRRQRVAAGDTVTLRYQYNISRAHLVVERG